MRSSQINIGDSILSSQYNNLRKDAYGGSMLLAHEQGTPNMTLAVESGVCYVGATRVIFAGGNSPSFTAPTTNPRIDILTIDSAGVLAITQGTEAASPTPSAYPSDKLVICEVYNRVGQTTIRDTDIAGQGYIYNDVRPFLGGAYIATAGQIANGIISDAKIDSIGIVSANKVDGAAFKNLASIPSGAGTIPIANLPSINGVLVEKVFTYGETISAGQAVYLKASDGKVYKAATNNYEAVKNFLGFAQEAGVLNNSKKVAVAGIDANQSALTIGSIYYLSDTAGAISTTAGSIPMVIGIAKSTTEIVMIPFIRGDIQVQAIVSSNTRGSHSNVNTTSSSYTEVIAWQVPVIGAVRVYYQLLWGGAAGTAYSQVYVNGIAVGIERSTTTNQFFTDDISNINVGDRVSIYAKAVGTSPSAGINSPVIQYDIAPKGATTLV